MRETAPPNGENAGARLRIVRDGDAVEAAARDRSGAAASGSAPGSAPRPDPDLAPPDPDPEPRVVELTEVGALHEAAELLARVWQVPEPSQVVDPDLLRALAYTGNYVSGAYLGVRLVGVCVAFRTAAGDLHSHVTGVEAAARGRGIGLALKLHQRRWALDRGIPLIRWTFDPLVLRNAWFDIERLGGSVEAYLPDFYGPMVDGINASGPPGVEPAPSDRLLLAWRLDAPRVLAALGNEPAEPHAGVRRINLPPDVEALRARDPEAARRWRYRLRDSLTEAFENGERIVGVVRPTAAEPDAPGAYLLAGKESPTVTPADRSRS